MDDLNDSVETTEVPEAVTTEAPEAGGDNGEPTLDSWEQLKAKGYDPLQLEKSHTRFTQELESVKAQARDLEPYKQLKDILDADPSVLAAFEAAMNGEREDEDDIEVMRRELNGVKSQIRTERELESVRKFAEANDYPTVDDRAVITHAMSKNLGSLEAAYKDMNFDAIREIERERALKEVKDLKTTKTVNNTASPQKATKTFTRESIAAMSPQEFEANRTEILKFYSNQAG